MVTRSRVGTTRPNPRYVGHVSTISPLPRSYKEVFNYSNWRNAMFDDRYKARLVANGSTQVEGVDVDETFSPVVKSGTIKTVLSLVISRHWHVHQLDRTKYIEIDIHFVRDLVATGQVRVLHVPSWFQHADIFTKGLPSALFDEFCDSFSVRCTFAPTGREYYRINVSQISHMYIECPDKEKIDLIKIQTLNPEVVDTEAKPITKFIHGSKIIDIK
nr:ribonuclease H-like domain-containing protein [Tanacetum cinerariifolium]